MQHYCTPRTALLKRFSVNCAERLCYSRLRSNSCIIARHLSRLGQNYSANEDFLGYYSFSNLKSTFMHSAALFSTPMRFFQAPKRCKCSNGKMDFEIRVLSNITSNFQSCAASYTGRSSSGILVQCKEEEKLARLPVRQWTHEWSYQWAIFPVVWGFKGGNLNVPMMLGEFVEHPTPENFLFRCNYPIRPARNRKTFLLRDKFCIVGVISNLLVPSMPLPTYPHPH